jgi:hypothetical protein
MAEQFDIKTLSAETAESRLLGYVAKLPDGKAVPLIEAANELGITYSPALLAAKKAGIIFNAFLPGLAGSARAMTANPKSREGRHPTDAALPGESLAEETQRGDRGPR